MHVYAGYSAMQWRAVCWIITPRGAPRRTYKYSNIDKKQQVVADEEILQKLICALEI